jgi:glycosyltransferase involved in cell wall biosynthesis
MTEVRRICHVTTVHPWWDTRIFERMCLGLADRGYEVILVAPIDAPRREQGIQLVPTDLSGKISRLVGAPLLLRKLRRLRADVYHFHDPELLPWMTLFSIIGRSHRVVYDVHEYYPEAVHTSNYFAWRPLSRLAGAVFSVMEPALARRLDGVVGVTSPIAARFDGGAARVAVVSNMVAVERLPESLEQVTLPSPQTVVIGGVMDRSRLMTEVIDAMGLLAPNWPALHLLGIGDLIKDPYGAELKARAEALGIGDRISFRARVPWATLQAYLASSIVGLVLFSDWKNNRLALPNRLFEFMAHGVPIVGTDFLLIREIVSGTDCGILLDSGRPESIAAAIDSLLRDPAAAKAMGKRGRAAVRRRYRWEVELDRLETLYRDL